MRDCVIVPEGLTRWRILMLRVKAHRAAKNAIFGRTCKEKRMMKRSA